MPGKAKPFEDTALLPEEAEVMMTDAILAGRCDQQFVLDLRRLLVRTHSVECPVCRGTGLRKQRIEKKIYEAGCEVCHGTGHRPVYMVGKTAA